MTDKIDIRKLNIPNVCFSYSTDGDKREPKYKQQRQERGFDDTELWNLDVTIAKFILPRLKRFRETSGGSYPGNLDNIETWQTKLDEMIKAFELIAEDDPLELSINAEKKEAVNKGLDTFREYYFSLWN